MYLLLYYYYNINPFLRYRCDCEEGYEENTGDKTCEDIDECLVNNGRCEDKCENKNMRSDNMTHECSCETDGYKLGADGRSCVG